MDAQGKFVVLKPKQEASGERPRPEPVRSGETHSVTEKDAFSVPTRRKKGQGF
jgi:hypothetical protein